MVAMRSGAVAPGPMGSCDHWHLRAMALRVRTRHAPRVPTAAGPDRVPAPLHPVRRRRAPGVAPLLAALVAAILLLGVSSTGVLAATTMTPKCDSTNLRTGASTTYTKKT